VTAADGYLAQLAARGYAIEAPEPSAATQEPAAAQETAAHGSGGRR